MDPFTAIDNYLLPELIFGPIPSDCSDWHWTIGSLSIAGMSGRMSMYYLRPDPPWQIQLVIAASPKVR